MQIIINSSVNVLTFRCRPLYVVETPVPPRATDYYTWFSPCHVTSLYCHATTVIATTVTFL